MKRRTVDDDRGTARRRSARRRSRFGWIRHGSSWRDPARVASQWDGAADFDPALLQFTVHGDWWATLARLRITLLVTREYEHLLMAARVAGDRPVLSYLRLPHPSGLAVDRSRGHVYVASTRNPNQVLALAPIARLFPPPSGIATIVEDRPLLPIASRFYPGALYLHDLACMAGVLYGNAVGQNAVVRLGESGTYERVWWPRCIEMPGGPVFARNHLQLNSIAAGSGPETSFYTASTDRVSARRPGHRNFPVDGRGVIFSGKTREPMARGLTRPHSARLRGRQIWVDNSGYGEVGVVAGERFERITRLPGWTRGLAFCQDVCFAGTSRIIPRFYHYAPGVKGSESVCGVYAIDVRSGRVLGSLLWPAGSQIFAIEWVPATHTGGLPFRVSQRHDSERARRLFYGFVSRGDRP
jgi:uncharacterized protein (TIGR03032 family)